MDGPEGSADAGTAAGMVIAGPTALGAAAACASILRPAADAVVPAADARQARQIRSASCSLLTKRLPG